MQITVTQDDIDKGVTDDCESCPVALAINRLLKYPCSCLVMATISIVNDERVMWKVPIPQKVRTFVHDFDLERLVKPFEFKLNIPQVCFK